ncbi:TetR family transcriptional regulator [Agromyces luteolus]|uniref:TetR family transcriptional regulator n=2 Tax=Agromyces luteolus TaxID=88373 RepID=A0A7C9HP23_9MICO|nr:TetR family transcriptional regulator [Agromyces luteolus]
MSRMSAAERRPVLIEAGVRVIAREGIAGASTRAIVAEAGMSLASFHYAFESREAFLDELTASVVARESQAVLPLPEAGGDMREVVEAGLVRYLDHLRADPAHEQAMLELTQHALRAPERHPLAVAQYRRYADLAEEALTLAAERAGATWRVPVPEVASVLIAFSDGITLNWLVHRDDRAALAAARAAADALSRMAAPR